MIRISRRQFLGRAAAGGAAMGVLGWSGCASRVAKPDFSIAFMTDMHVQKEKRAAEGWRASLRHVQEHPANPDFIVTGGDLAMDILATDVAKADEQYDLYFSAIDDILRIPVHHVLGNHDCLGIYEKSGLTPDHPLYGKEYFRQRFQRESTYTSFDHRGWHFVLLDTVGFDGRRYIGHVDEEQLAWLERDLAEANKPTVVFGHIPLFSNLWELGSGLEKPISDSFSVVNADDVAKVLAGHPVKLSLSGHLHQNETWTYKGVEFANVGAVSGGWWSGEHYGFGEGYALLSFAGDSVSWRYVDYGWEVASEAEAG